MAHIFEVMWTLEQKRLDNSFWISPFFLFSLLICLFMYNFLLILKFLKYNSIFVK